jgi:hypothetical protein
VIFLKDKDFSNYQHVEVKNGDGKILSSKEELDIFIKKIQSAFDWEKIRPYIQCFNYQIEDGFILFCREGIILIESKIHIFGYTIRCLKKSPS